MISITSPIIDMVARAERPEDASDCIRILVVDDSKSVCELIGAKLRDLCIDTFNVRVDLASSGEEALQLAHTATYDVIFLDVEMPGIGGLEACRQLRTFSPARIVMLSGMSSGEDHEAGRAAGCHNYLTKPPHDADLRSILRLVSLRKQTMV